MDTNVLKPLFSFAQLIQKYIGNLKKEKKEDKEKVINFLISIATSLEKIASDIRLGKASIEECHALCVYIAGFDDATTEHLDDKTYIELLGKLLKAAERPLGLIEWELKRSLMVGTTAGNKFDSELKERANTVEKVAGIFRGSANTLKATL